MLPIAALVSALCACGGGSDSTASSQTPTTPSSDAPGAYAAGNLLVSRSVYDPGFTVSGTILEYNGNPTGTGAAAAPVVAVVPGTFPNVFTNEANDANFGVTSAIWLDQWAPDASSPFSSANLTQAAKTSGFDITTSFPSKSELALNVSLDKSAITFMGYNAPVNSIDVSNSNTPDVIDPSNTDVAKPAYRTVARLNLASNTLSFTNTDAYSGNNGRAAVLAGGVYYLVGNAGNSGKNPNPTYDQVNTLALNTGVQSIAPGSACALTQVIGAFHTGNGSAYAPPTGGGCTPAQAQGVITDPMGPDPFVKASDAGGNQFGFTIADVPGETYDKTGKDNNFRGLFVGPDGTMYVSKGSGSNGVNTVYQVGATGALANGGKLAQNAPISIAPGFPTTNAANLLTSSSKASAAQPPASTLEAGVVYPFGMWIPANNASLMFVGDEGDGGTAAYAPNGSGGLWVYRNSGGTWTPVAHIIQGLNLGQPYTVTDAAGLYGAAGANYATTADGLRNITGQVNSDGSYTVYAVTSTIGNSLGSNFDAGADSNQLVKINLTVSGSTVTTNGFSVMQTAPYGQVLRGVAIAP